MQDYPYKTPPLAHQKQILEETWDRAAFALFHEMGCGKTKIVIDNIAYLYSVGKIDGALIIAPNGVDLNWLIDEIPKHLPEKIQKQSRVWRFSTQKQNTKAHQEQVKWNREHHGLAWLLMSYNAVMTQKGKEALLHFLQKRKTFYVLDESVSIKTPGAKRTMRLVRTGPNAQYRRILDGYPNPQGAFDLYSQIRFLDGDFWKRKGWADFFTFKHYFGVFRPGHNHQTDQAYEELLGYQHLEELSELIKPIASRLRKADVLDLPPKIYEPRYFELTPTQRKMYDELENEFKVWLEEQDDLVVATLAIVRMLRLQQISCGYLPTGEGEPVHMIEGENPRLVLLRELVQDIPGKMIIWARYRLDIQLIQQILNELDILYVTYIGETSDEDRIKAKKEFQEGSAKIFLGTPSAAGIGLTLHAAHTVIYYSNSFNLRDRVQSEDRAHRAGLDHPVTYIDLLGVNTVDRNIMLNLCGKLDRGDIILGDEPGLDIRSSLKKWLED